MYITITAQKLGDNYAQSVADFVAYLEKENQDKPLADMERFFNQYGEDISRKEVIRDIDTNTSKLKKKEPKFYSITVNPSTHELKQIQNHREELKQYTRQLMADYAKAFHREIDGRPVSVKDIVYYAKIEQERTYKGTDKAIRENAPYRGRILSLKNDLQQIQSGKRQGDVQKVLQHIKQLEQRAPHKLHGQMIAQGMKKEGLQTHIHIIVSRKDRSNRFNLSPGSKYKASPVEMNGNMVKRGFDRDVFFKSAETTFDTQFGYQRNYVESYEARKTLLKNPKSYFTSIMGLPANEKTVAFKLMGKAGVDMGLMGIPTNKVQVLLKSIKQLKRGVDKAVQSSSIGL